MNLPFKTPLTLVYGPTASGKTTLIDRSILVSGLQKHKPTAVISPGMAEQIRSALMLLEREYTVDKKLSPSSGSVVYSDKTIDLRYASFSEKLLIALLRETIDVQSGNICSIIYPETGQDPSTQAFLGSLLIDYARIDPQARYVIETHSELIILRILRMIREGSFSPEDIEVYVMDQWKPYLMRIDPEGDFIDRWPGGFFEERMKELF